MKNILCIGLLLLSAGLFSQNNGGIKGMVTDRAMNNEPVLMANVQLNGQEFIAQTNFHGNFEISNLSAGTYILMISYLGYETVEILVTIEANIAINIVADLNPLQIDLGAIAGMDRASTEEVDSPVNTEKSPRK